MNNLQKVFWALFVFTVILWIGVGIFYWQTKVPPAPAASHQAVLPSPTSYPKTKFLSKEPFENWSVYKNATFSYQLRYPPELIPHDEGKISEKNLDLVHFVLNKEGKTLRLMGVITLAMPFESFKGRILADEIMRANASEISINESLGIRTFYIDEQTKGRKDEVYFPSKDKVYTYRIFCFTEAGDQNYLDAFEKVITGFSFVE